jgi:hypothetical protein
MTLSTRTLKVMSGAGAVAICGVSGVLVAIDPKPIAAPLHPAVGEASPEGSLLVVPGACGGGETSASLDPSLLPVAQQVLAASTAAARRTILASLTSSQRLEVEAYVRSLRRTGAGTGNCGGSADPGGSIAPSVVDAPPSTQPLINTYVS